MMKKIPYIKFTLDILIGVTFALFYNKNVLGGLAFHEIAGLVICGAFVAHVLLNINWVKNVTLKLFDRKLPWKTKLNYVLNLLLLITMTTIIVTEILISRVVFPNLTIGNEQWMKMLHLTVSYLTLIIVAVHVGLHWQWVINMFKKVFKIKSSSKVLGYTAKIITVLMLLFGVYEMYATGFGNRVAQSANMFSTTTQQGPMGEGDFSQNGQPPEGFDGERPTPPSGDFQDNENATSDQANSQTASGDNSTWSNSSCTKKWKHACFNGWENERRTR
ncbi:DUF4405 domain-containing protein [Bacillus sp. T3]|uniref:DUF4405 domain-containing protein n=1 Tax=Bacillus sp. T3 TaxID=467262 RepID=UPI002982235E|nr:DUF4405 domain-containing protein [Bacillus sp. T3]